MFTVTLGALSARSRPSYSTFSVTAPADPRLPDGGGYAVAGFWNINPDKAATVPNNYFTLARNYGKQTDHWSCGRDVARRSSPRRWTGNALDEIATQAVRR